MHCLVTGATGFVGRHLVAELLNGGHRVTVTAPSTGRAAGFSWFSNVTFVEYTISEPRINQDLYRFFGEPDTLIHLAWPDVSRPLSAVHTRQHLFAQYAFLENLIQNGLTDLTIAGSCFEYGLASGLLDERIVPDPTTPYGIAKDSLRKFLEVLLADFSFTLRWIRLFYMYGEGQHPNSLFSQLETAIQRNEPSFNMSGGEQLRDYLPVQEAARIFCQLASQSQVTGIINCCSGQPISVRQLVDEHLQRFQSAMVLNVGHYPYRSFEPMASWGAVDKMHRALASLHG
ncbi:NAD(P)-dependent oxidoreductase [Spirosoma sp. KNUC1025]|uniref:NAD-dependent epimerase/dehydratase family protein n=1 Tax=Spirosoma sp. KNUC1025 TaxID=2894082 RepID=UPI00386E8599|nr:NAD(P)-dependent oxidoreductase [Spirosoma sp. KNUC1025]